MTILVWLAFGLGLMALVVAFVALTLALRQDSPLDPVMIAPEIRAKAERGWERTKFINVDGNVREVLITHDARVLLNVKDDNQKRRWANYVSTTSRDQFFEHDVKDITR